MATRILNIPIYKIVDSPFQGRFFQAKDLKNPHVRKQLEELKRSIENAGLLQPITVRRVKDKYELIDGHRRLEAYRQLDKGNVPAIIKEADDKNTQVMSVVANLQRSNLSNLERALAFEKILNAGIFKNKKELSRAIGKDETYIGDLMNMLKMDERILNHVAKSNPNADVRALRIIRKAGKLDKSGKSDKQHKLYLNYVHKKLSREQLQKKVVRQSEAEKQDSSAKQFEIQTIKDGYKLSIGQKLNKNQQGKLKGLLEEKLTGFLQEL